MTVKEFYEQINGDYQEIMGRLATEDRIKRFLVKFLETDDMTALKNAWNSNNAEQIFAFAHRLKGIALNLSLIDFAHYSSELTEQFRGGSVKDEQQAVDWYSKCVAEYEKIEKNIKSLD